MKDLITKTINGQIYTFKMVDGILMETVDSFILRGGVVESFTMNGKPLSEAESLFEEFYKDAA